MSIILIGFVIRNPEEVPKLSALTDSNAAKCAQMGREKCWQLVNICCVLEIAQPFRVLE